MNRAVVLVVEDDRAIRRGLVDALDYAGFSTIEAEDGDAGLSAAVAGDVDLVLLDVLLPDIDGFAVLERLRAVRPALPVIVLTARGREEDRVRGLGLGADDYVVKPFSVPELLARVEAVLRRSPGRPVAVEAIELPGRTIDFARQEVRFADGTRTALGEQEQRTLLFLAGNRGRVVSRAELLQRVYGLDPQGLTTRAVDMRIARLRERLRDPADAPQVILTVRGVGYSFVVPEAR
ncbi:MAG: response regulator transcription factor [Planctomycetes bacterium]|nr:response regulator transcription factor [Planctomycetota bacterium]